MPRYPRHSPYADSLSARVYSTLLERARSAGGPVFALHVGDTYREPLLQARAESQRAKDHPRLHNYAAVQGEPELLDAIVAYVDARHGVAIERDDLQVMAGTTAGLNVICQVLLSPGDEVLIPAPFWPLVRGIVATKGAVPVQVPFFTRLDDPAFDPEAELEAAITERTAALYINTPHNPTGRMLPSSVIDAMLRVAVRHDLWVLADEAYEEIFFSAGAPPAVWARPEIRERAIACHTLSKSYGLAGARIGFAHGPSAIMQKIRGMQTFQTYCAARPMQFGGARALVEGSDWLEETRTLYQRAARLTAEALDARVPEGGTFVFIDVSSHLDPDATDSQPFLERCADAGVLLTPGRSCGAAYQKWVRLCFTAVGLDELESALERLHPIFTTP